MNTKSFLYDTRKLGWYLPRLESSLLTTKVSHQCKLNYYIHLLKLDCLLPSPSIGSVLIHPLSTVDGTTEAGNFVAFLFKIKLVVVVQLHEK